MVSPISKKKKEISLEVIGGNAEGVTGSCTKIEFFGRTILFELGMVQDNTTVLENYKANCAIMNKVKAKDILDAITASFTKELKANYDKAYTHSQSAHAPSNAQANVIESVKVNGSALTPSSKAVNITVPTKVSDLTNDKGYISSYTNTTYSLGATASATNQQVETEMQKYLKENDAEAKEPVEVDKNEDINTRDPM